MYICIFVDFTPLTKQNIDYMSTEVSSELSVSIKRTSDLLCVIAKSKENAAQHCLFDSFLQSGAQIAYINHFLHNFDTFPKAEELFGKFLKYSPSVDLCRFYLNYVR
jgi:hypothetical protein